MRISGKFPYLQHDGVLAFAHRGGNRHAAENTMAAFADAIAQGYRYLETDVHVSKDGVVYAFHDDNLHRMVGEEVAISTLTAQEIDALKVHGDHQIPRMAELLESFPEVRFNIDAKAWPVVAPLANLIRHMQVQPRVCIGAFSDARITKVLQLVGENLCHSVGPRQATRFRLAAWLQIRVRFSAGCLQFPERQNGVRMVTKASLTHAHRLGLQMHVWTINDEAIMHRLLDMGVDGLMSDDCVLLKRVLQARNLW